MLMLLRMRCVCSVVRWDLCLLAAAAATAAAALVVVPTKQVDRHNLLMVLIAKDSGLTILIVPTCEGILVVRRDKTIHPNGVRHDPQNSLIVLMQQHCRLGTLYFTCYVTLSDTNVLVRTGTAAATTTDAVPQQPLLPACPSASS